MTCTRGTVTSSHLESHSVAKVSPNGEPVQVLVANREVRLTSPQKVIFERRQETKLDLVNYYLAVGDGALRAVRSRPTVMKRFPHGAAGDSFFQKRVPANKPEWLSTATVAFPSGRTATELCPTDLAHIIWAVNNGSIENNPWPTPNWDPEHPDELRVDLDPQPGVTWTEIIRVAQETKVVLEEHGIVSWPKTSGSRGIHIYARLVPKYDFTAVRRAALALARELEHRLPDICTSKWWKEERGRRVFVDYNQNARDRTVASAYSVRPTPDARVSAPVTWAELPDCELGDFTIATMPARYAQLGDLHEAMDDTPCTLDGLLDLADRDEHEGLSDAPWPPNFPKTDSEPRRVQPSRARAPKHPE